MSVSDSQSVADRERRKFTPTQQVDSLAHLFVL